MRAMVLESSRGALAGRELERPRPAAGEVLIAVRACAVCRTDLHLVDGDLEPRGLPRVPGHEIVGDVVERGPGAERFAVGERIGVGWLSSVCGRCASCTSGRENLRAAARFTGYDTDGGFAEFVRVDERFAFALPENYDSLHAAPLLCAGAIGYRALRAAGDPERLGLWGFGAAAHLVLQLARHEGRRVFAFTRPGDRAAQALARSLGAEWAGSSLELAPSELDAALLFAPVGELVPRALAQVARGGTVVCAGIHMSDIPSFPYSLLWGERVLRSIANLTRRDGEEFLALAARVPLRVEPVPYALAVANVALDDLRAGRIAGAAVLLP
ncbi:MAG: zinc-dependent alcohol dehydrogenase family protein [Planctomycetes bacterium]|nr:zinc-dependent alcohol dehydrogenase family protein [Planctomycetota bacterium]